MCLLVVANTSVAIGQAQDTLTWHDAAQLGVHGQGYPKASLQDAYHRLPAAAQRRVPASIWSRAQNSAGLSIQFKANRPFTIQWSLTQNMLGMPHMPATGVSGIDVYYRPDDQSPWRFDRNGTPNGKINTLNVPLRSAEGIYCVYLPLYNGVESMKIGVATGGTVTPVPPSDEASIVFYGTSITQGACASRPGMNHLAIVERALNRQVINLGFSGSAKCEPEMADLLARVDAGVYVIDALPNMTEPLIHERFDAFITRLHAAKPQTPIVIYDHFTPTVGSKSGAYQALDESVQRLQKLGIAQLHYVECRGMLGEDDEGTVDGTHLNDLGHFRQAQFMINTLTPLLESASTENEKRE